METPSQTFVCGPQAVRSQLADYSDENYIIANYLYKETRVDRSGSYPDESLIVDSVDHYLRIRTAKSVPRLGVLLVGLGGNNGTTVVAGIQANKRKLQWRTKTGIKEANWLGSVVLSSTTRLGIDKKTGEDIYVPLNHLVPMINPEDIVIGGWDISGVPLGDAMRRAQVLDIDLQDMLYKDLQLIHPMPAAYIPHFVAPNQSTRADNLLKGSLQDQLERLRDDIRMFRTSNQLDSVIVLWTATTERNAEIIEGVHGSSENWLKAIKDGHPEVSASALYATAAILEHCSFINGSPQNTFHRGIIELAQSKGVFLSGDDFKTGQTKMKSVLVDFLLSAGIKPKSIVSYNHLGNNDGANLSSPEQFRSKELSKSSVVDDLIKNNPLLYKKDETPDHSVVIKYVPYVGDSKRALDEYSSEIFLGGLNTLVVHNTCEDSLLAAPIIIDLILLAELYLRVDIQILSTNSTNSEFEKMHNFLSILNYFFKSPFTDGTPAAAGLVPQRNCIVNFLRACIGLSPENPLLMEYKLPHMLGVRRRARESARRAREPSEVDENQID